MQLAATYDLQLLSIRDSQTRGALHGLAKKLFPISLEMRGGSTETIEVPFTVNVEISFDKQGRIRGVTSDKPTAEALEESAHFVETLQANNQISYGKQALKGRETHELKTDEKGRKLLTRKRFTAS